MLIDGFILGVFSLAGFYLIYKKLPVGAKVFLMKHPLFTDITIAVVFYMIMGFTLVAHSACAVMTLGAMALMHIGNNPQDYDWINDSLDRAKDTLKTGLQKLKELNDEYKAKKMAEAHKLVQTEVPVVPGV